MSVKSTLSLDLKSFFSSQIYSKKQNDKWLLKSSIESSFELISQDHFAPILER